MCKSRVTPQYLRGPILSALMSGLQEDHEQFGTTESLLHALKCANPFGLRLWRVCGFVRPNRGIIDAERVPAAASDAALSPNRHGGGRGR